MRFHVKETLHLFITLDCNMLLESESFYIPVPSSDVEQTESGEFSLLISHCTNKFCLDGV